MTDEAAGYLAPARSAPGAPVLLLHAWWGLNQTIKDLADRLAGDGFTVFAPDLFDGTVLTTIEQAEEHGAQEEANSERTKRLVEAGLDALLSRPDTRGRKAGIVALSFGGWYGLLLAEKRPEIAAMVSIYADVFEPPGQAAYLGHFAANDQFVDVSHVPAPGSLGDRGEAYVYPGTKHWFMESDRPEYDAPAAELAHARTVEFLRRHLG